MIALSHVLWEGDAHLFTTFLRIVLMHVDLFGLCRHLCFIIDSC